jgi:hypothetical protein
MAGKQRTGALFGQIRWGQRRTLDVGGDCAFYMIAKAPRTLAKSAFRELKNPPKP